MTLTATDPSPAVAAERIDISDALRLWLATAAAHDDLAEVLAAAAGDGQTAGADVVAILLPLAEADRQRLRMNELAQRSHLTPSGLTRRIDRLETDGLVSRVSCPADRRGAHARLTPLGLDVARRAIEHLGTVLESHVAKRLSPQETAALSDLLARLSRDRAPG
jgi:DNA-binding MarR family transcriptional regulator